MKVCLWCPKELPKKRRKYCSDECAHQFFINKIAPLWWSNARKVALERTNNKCEKCGASEKIEVHHKEHLIGNYHNNPLNRQENLQVLCRDCHEKVHHPILYRTKLRDTISKNQSVMKLG